MSELHGKTISEDMREQWHAERRFRIGASEIATAIGINKYDSTLRLWLTKTGKLPPKESNEAMDIGNALESGILNLYQQKTGKKIVRTQVFYVCQEHDFLSATLDGITSDGLIVQVKNVGCQSVTYWGPEGTDEIPHEYIMQVQQEMLCSGLDLVHVVALLGGSEVRVYPIQRNERLIQHIIKLGGEFIRRVRTEQYPKPDKNRDQDLIKYLFTECVGTIDFDESQSADVCKWERLKRDLKLLESEVDQLKMGLGMAMGEAKQANLIDGRILTRNIVNVAPRVQEVKGFSYPTFRVKEVK